MLDFLHHLLFPRESNNHRARLLHLQPLFILVILIALMSYLTPRIERSYPDILGITANISISDLVNLTNQQRTAAGVNPLSLDSQLSAAAMNKANHMLENNYWAHNAPDGTTPWVFIKAAGYEYLYAGENLARGFTTAHEAMAAWMASPGHKENILSPRYKDVGFAVVTGSLTGDETVLIVQEFGERLNSSSNIGSSQAEKVLLPTTIPPTDIPQPTFIAQAILPTSSPIPTLTTIPTPTSPMPTLNNIFIASVRREPIINKDNATKNIALVVAIFFIFLFIVDLIITERRKIIRFVSHSADHIIFLTVIIIAIILYSRGLIL